MRSSVLGAVGWLVASAGLAGSAHAQTLSGVLLDAATDRPIPHGVVVLLAESLDSLGASITDESGRFSLHAPGPGSFVLTASALGYRKRSAGVFELGRRGRMTLEWRIAAAPLGLEDIIVALDRPVLPLSLVSNGFVHRMERGLGHFITPFDIESNVSARTTSDLFRGINGVIVGGGFGGQEVSLRGNTGRACQPRLYVDGVRVEVTVPGELDGIVTLSSAAAIEIYRRPAEVPVEYAAMESGRGREFEHCGVIVIWTRVGE